MGHYTEFMLKVELSKDVPEGVIQALHHIFATENRPTPANFPELGERATFLAHGGSAYHITFTSSLVYDDIAEAWMLAMNSSFKHYDNEIPRFLEWLSPHINKGMTGVVGYTQDEDYSESPTLIVATPHGLTALPPS